MIPTGASTENAAPGVPSVGVSVLNWNSGGRVLAAVQSVIQQTGVFRAVVLVVDNGSSDDAESYLGRLPDGVDRILLRGNVGYAEGMNIGYRRLSDCDYFVPLNDDASLSPGFLEAALTHLRLGEADCVAPLVVRPDGSLDSGPVDVGWDFRVVVPEAEGLGHKSCLKPNGSCPVYSGVALQRVVQTFGVGPFDPLFDSYGEDIDLALKLKRLEMVTLYCPESQAVHVRSASSAESIHSKPRRLRVNLLHGRWLNASRHLTTASLLLVAPAMALQDMLYALRGVVRGQFGAIVDPLFAYCRLVRKGPTDSSRSKQMRLRRLSVRELSRPQFR